MRTTVAIVGLLAVNQAATSAGAADPPQLVAVKAAKPPALDGRAEDAVWRQAKTVTVVAKGVMPKTLGTSAKVSLRAAYTDTHVYLLAVWDDATQDDKSHRTWKWDGEKKAYVEDTDREDMFAVAFQHTGEFTADMVSPVEAVWDIWHWKAVRTNPQGFAMDKTHRYSKSQPAGRANKHTAKDGTDIWIARPEDAGDTVEKSQPAPTAFTGDRVPRYLPGTPTGSAADVQAKGAWVGGRWTVEFSRKLDTLQADDTAFDPSRSYRIAVSVHDRTGEMDKASEAVVLSFRK